MENNKKYLLLRLEERNGEYEYIHRSVHILPDSKTETVNRIVDNYTKNLYGGNADPEDKGFYFQGGEVFVKVDSWEFISEEEFGVLKKYL